MFEVTGGLSKYGPLTAIICLFAFGVLLSVLADKTSRRTDVQLATVNASENPRSGRARNPGDRMDAPPPIRGRVAATNNPPQRPSRPSATPSQLAPQLAKVQVSVRRPKPAQRPSMSEHSPPSIAPKQDTVVVVTASPPAAQSGLPTGVTYASDTDPVRILSVSLSSDTVQAGDVASARVITTSNAAALTARIGTYQVNVPRVAPGTFALSMTVPRIYVPRHRVVIVVTAIRADGATTQRSVPLDVHF